MRGTNLEHDALGRGGYAGRIHQSTPKKEGLRMQQNIGVKLLPFIPQTLVNSLPRELRELVHVQDMRTEELPLGLGVQHT